VEGSFPKLRQRGSPGSIAKKEKEQVRTKANDPRRKKKKTREETQMGGLKVVAKTGFLDSLISERRKGVKRRKLEKIE